MDSESGTLLAIFFYQYELLCDTNWVLFMEAILIRLIISEVNFLSSMMGKTVKYYFNQSGSMLNGSELT